MTNDALKKQTAYLSIISNTILVLLKLIVGFYVGAYSLISEAMHSGVDLVAALIAFWAIRKSIAPPDTEHDYGHGKFENLSSVAEALLIVGTAIFIIYEAFLNFNADIDPEFLHYGVYLMIFSIIINVLVSRRLIYVAEKTDSQALYADGLHLQSDVWTSVGVLIGLALMMIFDFMWIDSVVAIVVALIIFRAGYKMIVEGARELTDTSLCAAEEGIIGNLIMSEHGVIGYHNLRSRKSGANKLIDVHVTFPAQMPLEQVHYICDAIEYKVKHKLEGEIIDMTIHPEPVNSHGQVLRNSVVIHKEQTLERLEQEDNSNNGKD